MLATSTTNASTSKASRLVDFVYEPPRRARPTRSRRGEVGVLDERFFPDRSAEATVRAGTPRTLGRAAEGRLWPLCRLRGQEELTRRCRAEVDERAERVEPHRRHPTAAIPATIGARSADLSTVIHGLPHPRRRHMEGRMNQPPRLSRRLRCRTNVTGRYSDRCDQRFL